MSVATSDLTTVATFLSGLSIATVEIDRDVNQGWTRFNASGAGNVSYTLTVFDDPGTASVYKEHRTFPATTPGQTEDIGDFDSVAMTLTRDL